jgi:putative molybdopterin biosynthesis protein
LKRESIDPGVIYGYQREEFTHLSVGALVSAGSADTGMGILAAAKIYGLDFIPVCEEQYDFIMPERFMELEAAKYFIEIVRSHEFKNTLDIMDGYSVSGSGETYVV